MHVVKNSDEIKNLSLSRYKIKETKKICQN